MKIKNTLQLFIGCVAATLAISSYAAPIVDINQADASVYMAGFSQGSLAQSFQPTKDNVAGAGINLQSEVGSTDIVTIALWDALPNQENATQLASASGLGTAGTPFDLFFNAVNVTVGQTYFLVFTSLQDTLGISGSLNNPYLYGNTFANSSFQSFADFDYTFRTYYEPAQQSNVPEPATTALLGLGLLGFAASHRKSVKSKNA